MLESRNQIFAARFGHVRSRRSPRHSNPVASRLARELPKNVLLTVVVAVRLVAKKSSDAKVSKLMPEIKVPSNVVSDTALRGLATKLHNRDALRSRQPLSAYLVIGHEVTRLILL